MKQISMNKNKLILENGKIIYLTKQMIQKFSLNNKDVISDEDFESLIKMRIKLSAYTMLSKKDYFKKEIKLKLMQKIGFENIIDEVIKELIEQDFIDDQKKAIQYVESHKSYGFHKLSYMLMQMGIDKNIINEILLDNQDNEIENIINQLKKMKNKDLKKKIFSLSNKGFKYNDIKKALEIMEETE